MRGFLLAAALACPACLISEKQRAPDLACAELPTPSTAPNEVTISGVVSNLTGDSVGAGVMIQGFASGLMLPPVVSDESGRFSYTHETAGVPNIAHIVATLPPFLSTDSYPGLPVAADTFIDVRMITMENALDFTTAAGIIVDPMLGLVLLRVTDCNESPLSGGSVSTTPAGDVYYFRLAAPDPTAPDTDASGIVMIANLPPGAVDLSGSVGGVTLRPHTVETAAGGSFVLTTMQP